VERTELSQGFDKRIAAVAAATDDFLSGGLKGVEKEALRVDLDGHLSQTMHPSALGSALTNRYITTDFSEALLEFITPAFSSTWETLHFLCDIHQFSYERLENELLWTASMPCQIPEDAKIPLARFGKSNVGQMKTIYRRGLGYRYGRRMQTIAGVHFNYSLPQRFWPAYRDILEDGQDEDAFRSAHYLGLVRNFRRFGWLVLYLFGASPAMCKSFIGADKNSMPELNAATLYEPFGTSLRMSDLGYSNQNQARIKISMNNLEDYIDDLGNAIMTPEPAYERIGVKVNGDYRQLSANRLQIENEYYSSIRPKRVAKSGERPTAALRHGGIEYVEIRSLDISVDDPAGINQNTMRFMEAFLIYCLLEDSPLFDDKLLAETISNQSCTAKQGRDPSFELQRGGKAVLLSEWAGEILAKVSTVASLIDQVDGDDSYAESVRLMQSLVDDPDSTPSARLLHELRHNNAGFCEFILSVAKGHRDYFASIAPLLAERAAHFEIEAAESLDRQAQIEASDRVGFDEYLAAYYGSG
jgi:glutamate--cysteine ligase